MEYNLKNFHAMHTLAEKMRDRQFPQWNQSFFRSLRDRRRAEWLEALWKEAVNLTVQQYGECAPRTHGEQPANNTPLMIMAKAPYPMVDSQTLTRMVQYLVDNGGGINKVDNLGMNAAMHAVGSGNLCFFQWFYEKANMLWQNGFDWEKKNSSGRNMLSLISQPNRSGRVYEKVRDLCKKGYITEIVHDVDPERPQRQGGASVANQRQHPRPKHNDTDIAEEWSECAASSDPSDWIVDMY